MNEQEHYRKEKRNNSLGTYTVFQQIHGVREKSKMQKYQRMTYLSHRRECVIVYRLTIYAPASEIVHWSNYE